MRETRCALYMYIYAQSVIENIDSYIPPRLRHIYYGVLSLQLNASNDSRIRIVLKHPI